MQSSVGLFMLILPAINARTADLRDVTIWTACTMAGYSIPGDSIEHMLQILLPEQLAAVQYRFVSGRA